MKRALVYPLKQSRRLMQKLINKTSRKSGLAPGTLIHIGEKKIDKPKITVIDYDAAGVQEKVVSQVEDCFPSKDSPTVSWINIDGLHQVDLVEKIGQHFNIHPLILEDIVHTGQRPKLDEVDDNLFIVLKMFTYDVQEQDIKAEQVSMILAPHVLISFQEAEGDVFEPIRDRIRKAKGRIRKMGSDYLCYALLDAIVDNYFVILEKLGEKIELLEEELLSNPSPVTLQAIHRVRGELIFLRRSVWPLREVINELERGEHSLIMDSSKIFFRDVYDHTIQVIDTIETCRDVVSGMLDMYLSSISNKMNEVMKVLTVIATIFIPLTFIAGIYGMNFEYMPELHWRWSYPLVWVLIVLIGVGMAAFFKRKKWL